MINFKCVSEITRKLRNTYKGIQSNSYGFCCNSDYNTHTKYINKNDYVCAKIFKGGLNNDYRSGKWQLGSSIYFMWNLTEFKLEDIIQTMKQVANEYGYEIVSPENESKCIELKEAE